MLCHLRPLFFAFILYTGFIHIYGCHAPMNEIYIPNDTILRYGKNGTLTYIKGNNISSSLDNDTNFIMLKNKNLYVEIAYEFLQRSNKLLKIKNPKKEFNVIDRKIDDFNNKHILFQQVMENIPIWAREYSIHLNGNNQVYLAQGHYEPTLNNVPTLADLSEQTAIDISKDAVSEGKHGWEVTEITKTIFMVDDRIPRLSYKITLVMGISGREYYFVDAMDGKILHRMSGIHKGSFQIR